MFVFVGEKGVVEDELKVSRIIKEWSGPRVVQLDRFITFLNSSF